LHARKVAAGKPKFIEAEKTVGEDNGVFWGSCNAETVFSKFPSRACNFSVDAHRSRLGLSSTGRESPGHGLPSAARGWSSRPVGMSGMFEV
jgi:hypothetical protein